MNSTNHNSTTSSSSTSTISTNNSTSFTMPDSTTESSASSGGSTLSTINSTIKRTPSTNILDNHNQNHNYNYKKKSQNTPNIKSKSKSKAAKRRQRSMKEVDEDLRYIDGEEGEDPQLMKLVDDVEDDEENDPEDYGLGGHSRANSSSSRCSSGTQSPDSEEKRRGRPRSDVVVSLMLQGSASPSSIKCQFCGRVFPREKSLQAHLRTHTGEKPYGCDFPDCGRAFTQSGQLKTHQRLHAGEKPFVCSNPGCTVRFTHANRHCPLHPGALLKRCYDFVIKPVINNDSAQSILIQQWLEKYKIERELASKSTSPPTSMIKMNVSKGLNANDNTTTIMNKTTTISSTIPSCKRKNNDGNNEQEQENVVNQLMSCSTGQNTDKEYSSPINNHTVNKSKRQILSQSPGYGQHLSPSKSININYFHHNNNNNSTNMTSSPSKNHSNQNQTTPRRVFGSPVKCLNLNWSTGSPGPSSCGVSGRTPASVNSNSRPEKLKRRWLESLTTSSSPSKDYKDYNKDYKNKGVVPTCLFGQDFGPGGGPNNVNNAFRPSVLVMAMAPVHFDNSRIKQEIRSHHLADFSSDLGLNNLNSGPANYYNYDQQDGNQSSELYITEHHGGEAGSTYSTSTINTSTNRLYISAENYLNNDPLNLSPQK